MFHPLLFINARLAYTYKTITPTSKISNPLGYSYCAEYLLKTLLIDLQLLHFLK